MRQPVYLDYNATTPVDERVVECMLPYLTDRFGNASSAHAYGYDAHEAIDRARRQVAGLIGAQTGEIVFTGGGSETDNLAIKGVVFSALPGRPHVVSTVAEHPAVVNTLHYLKRRFGAEFTLLPVDGYGAVSAQAVRDAIRPETVLVTVMHANNEVGTVQPLREIADVAREAGVLFHTDAAQTAGKIEIAVTKLGVDMLTIAGHKLYAPKGIGALYVRTGIQLDPLVHGSRQEHGLRAGTENVPSIVGLGLASELAQQDIKDEAIRLTTLRDELHRRLEMRIPGLLLNGHPVHRLPNTLNVSLPGVTGHAVLGYTPDVAASTGSACHSGTVEPSAVLLAMGMSAARASGALRLSLGRWSSHSDVEQGADLLAEGYAAAREMVALTP